MKEETRKILALWLVGGGVVIKLSNIVISGYGWWEMFKYELSGWDVNQFLYLYNLGIHYCKDFFGWELCQKQ